MRPIVKEEDRAKVRGKRKPDWLKVPLPTGETYERVKHLIKTLKLHTVCEEALCPNVGECWAAGTATVMILGDTCTRACKFCAVKTGNPKGVVDHGEPLRVALAISALGLRYVVITSVDRDDLPDGGAAIFAETIQRIHELSPKTVVEGLIPDFQGDLDALRTVTDAHPEVLGTNIETVRRLTPTVRDPRASYDQTLTILEHIKKFNPKIRSKSGLMVGLGETEEEVLETMDDLRSVGVEILTIGQYLQPTARHLPVVEWVTPEKFRFYQEEARKRGFRFVAAGPLVRSSYRAWESLIALDLEREGTSAG